MKKLMVGVGCPELISAESDDVGSLQSLFDIEQAKNIATYVHEGSAVSIVSIHFIYSNYYSYSFIHYSYSYSLFIRSVFNDILKYFRNMITDTASGFHG